MLVKAMHSSTTAYLPHARRHLIICRPLCARLTAWRHLCLSRLLLCSSWNGPILHLVVPLL